MKILTTKNNRSMIAMELRKCGRTFTKEKGRYIQGDLEIWFLDEDAINETHIEWADIICGYFYSYRVSRMVDNSGKKDDKWVVRLVQEEVHGKQELFQVVTRFADAYSLFQIDVKPITVLEYEVSHYINTKQCFKTEKEAVDFAYALVQKKRKAAEESLKHLKKLEKDWKRSIESF